MTSPKYNFSQLPEKIEMSEWAYPWNAPLLAVSSPVPTYDEIHKRERQLLMLVQAREALESLPLVVRQSVNRRLYELEKTQGIERANAFLTKNFVDRILPRISMVMTRYHLSEMTADNAQLMWRFNRLPDMGRSDVELLAQDIASFIRLELGVINDETINDGELKVLWFMYRRAGVITQAFRQDAPLWEKLNKKLFSEKDAAPAIARMISDKWWTNRLRRYVNEWKEHLQIALVNVSKKSSAYASKSTIHEWKEQKRRTREFLKGMELEDEDGNRISLIDKYYGSVANPAIRRSELMVRIRGFENICEELGFVGEFYTLTAPSKFHANTIHGHRNRKWNGASPADTQRYLRRLWEKVRAKLHRDDLRVFGIRVAEPHHDGTPHWHMLIFMRPEESQRIREVLRSYAFEEDADELLTAKAEKARFHAEAIDPDKGSATGYVAKYISKNIDGYALDGESDDESDLTLKDAAAAASAWAARWRIRQFQFIGGVPVTVYRELRRMADHDTAVGLSVEFAAVHDAADTGDWAGYINAQGGPFVRRDELAVRTWYDAEDYNDYGEEVIKIKGVFSSFVGIDTPILTRVTQWKIVPKLAADQAAGVSGASAPSRSSVNNCTQGNRRRLSELLKLRGFSGENEQVSILLRGGNLSIGGDRMLRMANGQLNEYEKSTDCELWDGWNW
ncbi:replication endonuclease [Pectobacterium brasiliense]|uniref:replication endonuclease n=1 Tax=Pectobacterium brasiliense TaxID=180957 RepID=UPI001F07FD15|nr:replication endonuclease [Pectobacterium brasiliense]